MFCARLVAAAGDVSLVVSAATTENQKSIDFIDFGGGSVSGSPANCPQGGQDPDPQDSRILGSRDPGILGSFDPWGGRDPGTSVPTQLGRPGSRETCAREAGKPGPDQDPGKPGGRETCPQEPGRPIDPRGGQDLANMVRQGLKVRQALFSNQHDP